MMKGPRRRFGDDEGTSGGDASGVHYAHNKILRA